MWHTLADVLACQPYYPIILVRCRHDALDVDMTPRPDTGKAIAQRCQFSNRIQGPDDRLETILQKS